MLSSLVALDERVFQIMHQWSVALPGVWVAVALGGVYLVPIVLVWYWFARRRETALFAALSGIIAWLGLNNLIGALVVRDRPIPFIELNFPEKEFLFDRPGPSFPSDHTAFMTAITLAFYFAGERRVAAGFGVITFLTVLARIVTAQHWPGDIVVGALVGVVTVLALSAIRRPLDHWVIAPLVRFARKLGV